jgi:hypothetical protein
VDIGTLAEPRDRMGDLRHRPSFGTRVPERASSVPTWSATYGSLASLGRNQLAHRG